MEQEIGSGRPVKCALRWRKGIWFWFFVMRGVSLGVGLLCWEACWEVAGNYGALTLGLAEWVGLMSEGAGLSSGRGVGAGIILRGRGLFARRVLRNLLL